MAGISKLKMGMSLAAFVIAVSGNAMLAGAEEFGAVAVSPSVNSKLDVTRAATKASGGEIYEIGAGDKLRIKFFQREELSGEFRVRADGNISLPLIGAFTVRGRTPVELEQLISSKFFEMTSRSAFAVVDVVERRPFFVAGDVNRPGTFPYVPSMTVTHAIAIAGGLYRLPQAPNQAMDVTREQWRLRSAKANAAVQMATRGRLLAQLNSLDNADFPPLIAELVGVQQAEQIRLTQTRLFHQAVTWRRSQVAFLKESVQLAEEELDELRGRLSTISETLKVYGQDLETTEQLLRRGLTQRRNVYQKKYAISAIRTTAANVKAEIKRAELKRIQAVRRLAEFGPGEDRKISIELAAIEAQVEGSLRNIEASKHVISQAMMPRVRSVGLGASATKYVILRSVNGKLVEVSANSHDRVLPGDVVKVAQAHELSIPGQGDRPIDAMAPTISSQSGLVKTSTPKTPIAANPAQSDMLLKHLIEMKKLISSQSSKLVEFEESQRELAREVNDWKARYRSAVQEGLERSTKEWQSAPVNTMKEQAKEKSTAAGTTSVSSVVKSSNAESNGIPLPIQRPFVKQAAAPVSASRHLVVDLQTELRRVGCYSGKLDGVWGPLSQGAMERFDKLTNSSADSGSFQPSVNAFLAVRNEARSVCAVRQVADLAVRVERN